MNEPNPSAAPATNPRPAPKPGAEVRAYLLRLGLTLAFGIVVMVTAAVTAWHLWGPKQREVVRPAPVMPRGAVSTVPPVYQP